MKHSDTAPWLLGWGWDPATESLKCLSFGLFSVLHALGKENPQYSSEHSVKLAQEIAVTGGQSEEQCGEVRPKRDSQSCASAAAWGCCPDWGVFPKDPSHPSETALMWLKVTFISALGLQALCCGCWKTSPGQGFFATPDFGEVWFRPSVISFTLYWLLLHPSKWLRGKG